MAHTYYHRLTIVPPDQVNLLDPRAGIVIAETAATGRYILSDISWESAVYPNNNTLIAYHREGELKIYESLGMSLFDYIKAAAFQLGIENHVTAKFLLELEIIGENMPMGNSPWKYIWPIEFYASEAKSQFSERGTEYTFKFVHITDLGQSDLIQPIKESLVVEGATNLQEYFDKLQIELEKREYDYAKARQKAGSPDAPGGSNPAAADPFHDEYHFILEPDIEKFSFTTKGTADRGVQESWKKYILFGPRSWNITARPGTTITEQIISVLKSTKELSDLMPGRPQPATPDAVGSSNVSAANENSMLGSIYRFPRVETHTVFKAYDYIRGRYATKYIYFIYLADQINLYHYPDEIDLLNHPSNRVKAQARLNYYIREGLLRKVYYHNYTGLNSDILKVDLQFNQHYVLPSFSQVWVDRGETGPGKQNKWNDYRQEIPFVYLDQPSSRAALSKLRLAAQQINGQLRAISNNKGEVKKSEDKEKYNELQKKLGKLNKEISDREAQLAAKRQELFEKEPQLKNRKDLLESLSGKYAEDINLGIVGQQAIEAAMPNLRPRMEIDVISESVDIIKSENEALLEKIFAVQLGARDLLELDLEVIGDPYWLGIPNVLIQGGKQLDKIDFPTVNDAAIKGKLNSIMPGIDPTWNQKSPFWHYYSSAQWYKGSTLFYFESRVPDSAHDSNDMLVFHTSDQIVGIYFVHTIINEFKGGRWIQKLKSKRDLTIPYHAIPKGVTGTLTFEEYMKDVAASPDLVSSVGSEAKQRAEENRKEELKKDNLPEKSTENTKVSEADPKLQTALAKQKELLAKNPAPTIKNPVVEAIQLKSSGKSTEQAYKIAKEQYINQVNAHSRHMEGINKQAYEQAGVKDYKPYSAQTMSAMAITKSGSGGLEAWKDKVTNVSGPAITNNPSGIGYDKTTGRYQQFNSFNDGMAAANEHFNYGVGVKAIGKQGSDRLLLPAKRTGSEIDFLNGKLKGGGG